MLTASVIMTTYNASEFLIEQLDSIRTQRRQPDEVIIFDDKSSDNTVDLIEKYIRENALGKWTLYINEKNLGWKRNFIQALQKAKCDVVFPCDQDDIWMPDKLETMCRKMEKNNKILLLSGNCEIFHSYSDEDQRFPMIYSPRSRSFCLDGMWYGKSAFCTLNNLLKDKKDDTDRVVKIPFDEGVFSCQRQGCVMAVRHKLLSVALPHWEDDCPHDTLLWFYAALYDGLFLYEKKVIRYRHHCNNTGYKDTIGNGLTSKSEIVKIDEQLAVYKNFIEQINESDIPNKQHKLVIMREILNYCLLRKKFLSKKRISDGVSILKNKYVGKRQVIFDWLLTYLT